MYKHIVLWKIRASVNGMPRSEISIEVKRRLDELPAHIPEIVDYETAINIGDYGASFFDVSLVSTFENFLNNFLMNPLLKIFLVSKINDFFILDFLSIRQILVDVFPISPTM